MDTERRKPPGRSNSGSAPSSSAGLGSFLDSAPKTKTSRGSATVSGPISSKEEGEIYIRADGKKVRRVKKVVSKSSADAASASPGLGSFLDDSALKAGPKKKASGSATVTGYNPSKKIGSKSADEGEVYIRADGKKVRRVKKTVTAAEKAASEKGLGSFLDSGATTKPKMSGSATVTGYTPSKVVTKIGSSSAASDDGEVYIRADGKKVRRVRKTVTAADKAAANASPATPDKAGETKSASDDLEERKKKNLAKFLDASAKKGGAKKKKGGAASVAGDDRKDLGDFLAAGSKGKKKKGGAASVSGIPTGGVALSKSAEDFVAKYKKKKKPATTDSAASSDDGKPKPLAKEGLGNFLSAGDSTKPKMSGSATVTGYTPSKKPGVASGTSSAEEGEVYIRADGKKVRRVRKTVNKDDSATSSPTSTATGDKKSLGGFLDSSVTPKSKMSGSATVTGYTPSKAKLSSTGSKEEGEIYIRADGKKVRRIRKTKSNDDADATASTDSKPSGAAGLGNFLGSQASVKKPMSGSATVTGATSSKKSLEGEIYINKDGKKVRRVRKTPASSVAGDLATPASTPESKTGLTGFLNSNTSAKPKMSGSATVTGYSPSKSAKSSSASAEEGEIYIRADGKKVRRVRKPKPTDDSALPASQNGAPSTSPPLASPAPKNNGASTVAGETVIKVTPEGEIVLRADGKKVLRRKKTNASVTPATQDSDNSEVYRRADGKLVRRVRKGPKPSSAAGDLAGFLGTTKANGPRTDGDIATVSGDLRPKTSIDDIMKFKNTPKPLPELDPNVDLSKLTAEQFAIAGSYRIMLQQGLSPQQVHSRMEQDGVENIIISAVLRKEQTAAPRRASIHAGSALDHGLSAEDEEIAERYRKMLKMGMPSDAVRNKMSMDGVAANVAACVLGEKPIPSTTPLDTGAGAAPTETARLDGKENAPESGLSPDDEAIASRFRKMLKMGLPPDAVRSKMGIEGVDERIMQHVLGEEEAPASTPSPAPTALASNLSADDENIASQYRKMFKMGLPEDAVRQKMGIDGVASHIVASVMGEDSASGSLPSALSAEDETLATKYRKMFKMGLPEDAVKHKMVQDGVPEHVIAAVMGNEQQVSPPSPAAAAPSAPPTATTSAPASAASGESKFMVVMGPDHNPTPPPVVTTTAPLDPNEKFAVDMDATGDKKLEGDVETRFMTLEDIAKATGQNPDNLKNMVKERRSSSTTMPRFVLTPVNAKQSEDMFEVAVPKTPMGGAAAAASPSGTPSLGGPTMKDAGLDPSKKYSEVKDGQEVVDTKLAAAARAVSALGDMDMKSLLEQLKQGEMQGLIAKLEEAEKRQKKLEKQLAQAGVAIAEDIDYGEAKVKVQQIAKRMGEIGGSDVVHPDKEEQNRLREEYFKLEQEMERFNTALMLTDEYQKEQDRLEQKWEDDNAADNLEALKKIRRHMPVKIRHMSEADLTNTPSPNGKFLPKAIAKKFKRTNVLQAIRLNPDDLERMHPSTLENMRVTGLTLTERRALYCHLKPLGPKWEKNKAEKMTERKWTWYQMMKNNFKENLAPYQRHVAQYGPPHNHVGCPLLGKQCPIKADKLIDYDNDYGWPDGAEYELSDVKKADVDDPGAKAKAEALELAKEKKANERADLLKKHYKGKLLQVSKANGSCEAMDESMDKMEFGLEAWIEIKVEKGGNVADADKKKEVANFTDGLNTLKLAVLDFAQRSGMQISGKKKAGGDGEDIRSSVEASLADEVWETSKVYFKYIRDRMKEMDMRDTRVEKTIELLEGMLSELHSKNEACLKKLGTERRERSRELKEVSKIQKEIEEKIKAKEDAEKPPEEGGGGGPPGPPGGGGGRGGLLDAIAGGGRGGRGRGRGGGRGGLLDAIAGGRGRGRGRGRGGGGRGGLLDAIAGAKGRGRGGGDDGGRGGLMAAIAARGSGRGRGGGGDGGRGGLMAAIAARGRGG